MGARLDIRVQPAVPLEDVIMVPAALAGRAEADMARQATALGRLRQAFALAPLRPLVAAFGVMMERRRSSG
jgi:hypothetical protein